MSIMIEKFGLIWIYAPPITGIFFYGIYKNLLKKLSYILEEYGRILKDRLESRALISSFLCEVILQRLVYRQSKIRWLRHILISWGFILLFITDISFVILTRLFPQDYFIREFGRKLFDFSFDFFGLVILLGTFIALVRIYNVRESENIIYHDPVAVLLVLIATFSGFVLEALRLINERIFDPYSLFGSLIALLLETFYQPKDIIYDAVWFFHVGIAGALIAYIPYSRLIHIIATPAGRLMDSQTKARNEKIRSVAGGLMNPGYLQPTAGTEDKNGVFLRTKIFTLFFYILCQTVLLLTSTTYFEVNSIYFTMTFLSVGITTLIFSVYLMRDKEVVEDGGFFWISEDSQKED